MMNLNFILVSTAFSLWALIGDTAVQKIKSTRLISNRRLVFEGRGKPEYLEKNLLDQNTEPTNSRPLNSDIYCL